MTVRAATYADLSEIESIYGIARRFMRESGNETQWQGGYPSSDVIKADVDLGRLYAVVDGNEILAVFVFAVSNEPTYDKIYGGQWLDTAEYAYIHRVAVRCAGRGIASFIFSWCFEQFSNIKIDTHRDNIPMQKALEKAGFSCCGIIYLASGDERLAYQKITY